jgi:hypothetical protein
MDVVAPGSLGTEGGEMPEDTQWPNNVRTAPTAISVLVDSGRPLAIATQMKVNSPSPGFQLHFLRPTSLAGWRAQANKLDRSGAYASVKLVELTFHEIDADDGPAVT